MVHTGVAMAYIDFPPGGNIYLTESGGAAAPPVSLKFRWTIKAKSLYRYKIDMAIHTLM
jgi:hypothetical protein